jgi:hypothetical protein
MKRPATTAKGRSGERPLSGRADLEVVNWSARQRRRRRLATLFTWPLVLLAGALGYLAPPPFTIGAIVGFVLGAAYLAFLSWVES